ncbi:Thioredoxin-domain-containing protein [Mycena kentingensis (nom. inval.)]|nr:Thioredoxin-domain-containing protein [Mycena kentingensis (nom. inval.)]
MEKATTALTSYVEEALVLVPALRKISRAKRAAFALDLLLIALGCRTAWLVDVVAVQEPHKVFMELLRALRAGEPIFDRVQHIMEPASGQSFFVNIQLLEHATTDGVKFVLIQTPLQLCPEPPTEVKVALNVLRDTHCFPECLCPSVCVPLTAILLGYPIAYCPPASETTFLSNITLNVYSGVVFLPNREPHTMLKFSCPASLGCAPEQLSAALRQQYGPRAAASELSFGVLHETHTLARVAL